MNRYFLPAALGLLAQMLPLSSARAQHTAEQFTQIDFGFNLPGKWKGDLQAEFRNRWADTEGAGLAPTLFYTQVGAAYAPGPDAAFGGAYRVAARSLGQGSPTWEHRFSQQVSIVQRKGKLRFRERLMAEQRLFSNNPFQARHRWRLRGGLDYPLQGEKLDPGEAYLNHQAELVAYPFEPQPWELREQRFYTGIGWWLHNGQALEAGLENRTGKGTPSGPLEYRWILRLRWKL